MRQETGQQLPAAIPHISDSRPRPCGPLSTKFKRKRVETETKNVGVEFFFWSPDVLYSGHRRRRKCGETAEA